jgi:hypothetical protein
MRASSTLLLFCAIALGVLSCSGRDPKELGSNYDQYLQAMKRGQEEAALQYFYAAYLDALRSKDPAKAMLFFRPDMQAEARNAVRMGLEFVRILQSVDGRITDLRDLVGRALLKTSEQASFSFRNRTQTDRRDRVYQLTRLGDEWYFDPPDLGRARAPK